MKPVDCDFCGTQPSEVTVTRKNRSGAVAVRLRLCRRCVDLQQFVSLVQPLPTPACFHCGGPPAGEAECRNPEARLIGRVALCKACASVASSEMAAMLRVSNLWTPGVLELPPVQDRVFPRPPRGGPGPGPGLPFATN